MDWWQRLLSVDAPPHAHLESAELSCRGLLPWWGGLLLALAAGAGVVFLYYLERTRLTTLRRGLMAGLRAAAVALVILLLLRPVLLTEFRGERPRPIVLLLDNSQSMAQRDQRLSPGDRLRVAIAENRVPLETPVTASASFGEIPSETSENPPRTQVVRAVFRHPKLNLLDRLGRRGPVEPFLFGARARSARADREGHPQDSAAHWLDGFTADESNTALADAVASLLSSPEGELSQDGELPAAIVVMTDGRDNASKLALDKAARECQRLHVPLHIYGVGAAEVGNLQLKDVLVPETILFDDAVSVLVRWSCQGLKLGTAEITLTLGGRLVARKEVPVHPGDDLREVLTFTPRKRAEERADRLDLVATIVYKGTEVFTDDNTVTRPDIRVVDRKVKVLVVEGSPRWEYKFLQTVLLRDRRVDARFILVNGDPRAMQSGPPFLPAFPGTREDLFAFDLVIFGDVPASYLERAKLAWLRDFVREGGGLVHIAGRQHAPAGYTDTPLAEILPVEFTAAPPAQDPEARTTAFQPLLTDLGKRADMVRLAETTEENLKAWQELPGFYWHYPVTKLRPGAVALLVHPKVQAGGKPMPLLASHYYGKGQVLYVGVEETWRWRFNTRDAYFGRFWGQIVYKMGLPHLRGNQRRTQLSLERSQQVLGQPSAVYANLLDGDYRPLTADRVAGRLEQLDARPGHERTQEFMLEAVAGQPGLFRALSANDALGRFVLKVDQPEPAALEFRVRLPPQAEAETAGMAEEALREMARLSGGQFYREEDLHRLPEQIQPQKSPFVHRQQVLLWSAPLVFLLFVSLVTTEWLLRKFSNLS